jgi:hypothetical protein
MCAMAVAGSGACQRDHRGCQAKNTVVVMARVHRDQKGVIYFLPGCRVIRGCWLSVLIAAGLFAAAVIGDE